MKYLWIRRWALQQGGTHLFSDLKTGDRFHFPKHPDKLYQKGKAGWYTPVNLVTLPPPVHFRTGKHTAVVKVEA